MSIVEKSVKKGKIFFDLWKDIKCAECGECLNNEWDHLCYDTTNEFSGPDEESEIVNIKCYHHGKCRPPQGVCKYKTWNHIKNIGWDMIYVAWYKQQDTSDDPYYRDVKLLWKKSKI